MNIAILHMVITVAKILVPFIGL